MVDVLFSRAKFQWHHHCQLAMKSLICLWFVMDSDGIEFGKTAEMQF